MNLFQISNPTISLLFCAFLLIALSGATFKTYGCTCLEPSTCEAFGRASAIFIRRAVDGKECEVRKDKSGKVTTSLLGKVHFTVDRAFIGSTEKRLRAH
jgi:hypothetical protein